MYNCCYNSLTVPGHALLRAHKFLVKNWPTTPRPSQTVSWTQLLDHTPVKHCSRHTHCPAPLHTALSHSALVIHCPSHTLSQLQTAPDKHCPSHTLSQLQTTPDKHCPSHTLPQSRAAPVTHFLRQTLPQSHTVLSHPAPVTHCPSHTIPVRHYHSHTLPHHTIPQPYCLVTRCPSHCPGHSSLQSPTATATHCHSSTMPRPHTDPVIHCLSYILP